MAELTRRERLVLLALALLYAAVVIPIGIHKGADLDSHLAQAELLLRHGGVYATAPPFGTWWPPFALLALAPFVGLARWSVPVAKGSFALVNVACLAYAVWRTRRDARDAVPLALAAVAVPLQTNFEYLNLNAPLLALLVLSAGDLRDGRDGRAGVWLGLMTALKAFPGVLFIHFAYRRRWRGLGVGVLVALALTLLAVLPYGPRGGLTVLARWSELSLTGVTDMQGRSQSLPAILFRLGVGPTGAAAADVVVLGIVLLALRGGARDLASELAILMLVALLLSPVAHTHYYLLAYPAWLVVLTRAPAVGNRVLWYTALAVAGILTSGFLTLGPYTWRSTLLGTAIYAWGGLLLLLLLLLPNAAPERPPGAPC
ncbi:MAG TPA: glycosyltransferase family 87 protein [Gemmatimonadales bacterium]|nr:glycosyltransferase family 87 protein [Gemmatimonadales bacterium]